MPKSLLKSNPKSNPKKNISKLSSTDRLEALLEETEAELAQIEPQIEKLEKQIERLKALRQERQKLITLRLSIRSILSTYEKTEESRADLDYAETDSVVSAYQPTLVTPFPIVAAPKPIGTFVPDMAFQQASRVLRRKTSLNYELFRAIVLNGGEASTEQIKDYLLENNITQPSTGQGFESVELTDISSRVNYLCRKGLVHPDGRGHFVSCVGWIQD